MITSIKTEIQSTPKLPTGIKIDVALSPRHLLEHGFVMPVIIQTPSVLCAPPISNTLKTVQVMAHDNFGVLIGRDIMARWNIVWNGPSSCVFIAD